MGFCIKALIINLHVMPKDLRKRKSADVLEDTLKGQCHQDCDLSPLRKVNPVGLGKKEREGDDENVVGEIQDTRRRYEEEEGSIKHEEFHPRRRLNDLLRFDQLLSPTRG